MIAEQLNTYYFGYETADKYIKYKLESEIKDMELSMALALERNNLAAVDVIGESIFFYEQILKALNQEGVDGYVERIGSIVRTIQPQGNEQRNFCQRV